MGVGWRSKKIVSTDDIEKLQVYVSKILSIQMTREWYLVRDTTRVECVIG